jgi:hypothetical protein
MTDLRVVASRSEALEAEVGHPGERWTELKRRVQDEAITQFRQVQDEWLALMWSIDAYRVAGVPPRAMGRTTVESPARLAAIYRSKGNWFATLIALLLQNRVSQPIQPRTKVRGFSQMHQIDVAWPVREIDPLVCAETKVTGAPAFAGTPARSAIADFSNRRKELKFAATDLKLYRRQQETAIGHWGVWRDTAPPKTYFLWAARLRTEGVRGHDNVGRLVQEAQALISSYLDGAGLVAWRKRSDDRMYERVDLPPGSQITDLDDVLYRIESEIRLLTQPGGRAPEAVQPKSPAVDIGGLEEDTDGQSEA